MSLKEISLLPPTIKPSTPTGFMFAPPHDGFYSTVISEHVKYHSPTDKQDQTHTTILGHRMTDNVMIEWGDEKYRENFAQSVYIALKLISVVAP